MAISSHADSLRVFVLSGSQRAGSVNSRLAAVVARLVDRTGATSESAGLRDFDIPPYDGDSEAQRGQPRGVVALRDRIEAAQGFVIASPEYNASMAGAVKNAIDWVSRSRPQPFRDKHALLVSASPSAVGGNRGLWALRVPLESLGARVHPDMFSLAHAHEGFTDAGDLADPGRYERLAGMVGGFLDAVEADRRYRLTLRWNEVFESGESAPAARQGRR
ncbi:NADPH-dependent FMN reductase [Streptomyces sp. NPDC048639]|uniref:NADPH-dependent FMN reductase n=1 Tax=Streptomyces sp. NPDC048639 TaxID=3365581 RepID=UPI003719E43B